MVCAQSSGLGGAVCDPGTRAKDIRMGRRWGRDPQTQNQPNRGWWPGVTIVRQHYTYLDSEQKAKMCILVFVAFWPVFGRSSAQEPAQRPQLEERNINQRKAREIDSKASKNYNPKSGRESKSVHKDAPCRFLSGGVGVGYRYLAGRARCHAASHRPRRTLPPQRATQCRTMRHKARHSRTARYPRLPRREPTTTD